MLLGDRLLNYGNPLHGLSLPRIMLQMASCVDALMSQIRGHAKHPRCTKLRYGKLSYTRASAPNHHHRGLAYHRGNTLRHAANAEDVRTFIISKQELQNREPQMSANFECH